MKKAKEYRTKRSEGYSSSNGRSGIVGKSGSPYVLSDLSRNDRNFAKASAKSTSQEDILDETSPAQSIIKSVSYSVRVDEEAYQNEKKANRNWDRQPESHDSRPWKH
jgi:hypothetical protein